MQNRLAFLLLATFLAVCGPVGAGSSSALEVCAGLVRNFGLIAATTLLAISPSSIIPPTPKVEGTPVILQRDPAVNMKSPGNACGPASAASGLCWLAEHRGFTGLAAKQGRSLDRGGVAREFDELAREILEARTGTATVLGFTETLGEYLKERRFKKYEIEVAGAYNFVTDGPVQEGRWKNRDQPISLEMLQRSIDDPDTVVWANIQWVDKFDWDPEATVMTTRGGHWVTLIANVDREDGKYLEMNPDPRSGNPSKREVPIRPIPFEGTLKWLGIDGLAAPLKGRLLYNHEAIVAAVIILRMKP